VPVTSPVLESLTPSDRALLLQRAVPRTLRRGQSLYLAGEPARRAHIVAAGVIKLSSRNMQGRSTILGLALPGEIVGDVGALDGRPQPLDALAATRCEVVGIAADMLMEMIGRTPDAALELARSFARSLRCIYGSAAERTTGTCPARLAGRLLDLAHALGHARAWGIELDLPLAQEDLGQLAGMSRESTCKTLRTFKRAGVLDYRGRRVNILRPQALEDIRDAGVTPRTS
jgi:CRP/FNR family transcriptional regulator, cyclic AMP receptor protein